MKAPYIPERIEFIWSRREMLARWANIEVVAAAAAGAPEEALRALRQQPVPVALEYGPGTHEFVQFLAMWLGDLPESVTCWVHRGLTTSDVTDTATSQTIRLSNNVIAENLDELSGRLLALGGRERLAWTHARPAAPTNTSTQIVALMAPMQRCADRLRAEADAVPAMASGPVGSDLFWTGVVASLMEAPDAGPTMQAMPRDWWAPTVSVLTTAAATLEQISRWLWLGIRSGDFVLSQGTTSSSMPHKVNASRLERVWGMARLTRGLAAAMAESVAMWDERDLGHSSVERVAWPSMYGYVATAIDELQEVLQHVRPDPEQMWVNLKLAGEDIHSHDRAVEAQSRGTGYFQARKGEQA